MTTQPKLNRSSILSLAWAIRKQSGLSWGECQRKAWATVRLRSAMQAGPVNFSYTKEDGTTRPAVGTLNAELFQYESKGTSKQASPAVIKYFDLEAGGFRSFRAERLLLNVA